MLVIYMNNQARYFELNLFVNCFICYMFYWIHVLVYKCVNVFVNMLSVVFIIVLDKIKILTCFPFVLPTCMSHEFCLRSFPSMNAWVAHQFELILMKEVSHGWEEWERLWQVLMWINCPHVDEKMDSNGNWNRFSLYDEFIEMLPIIWLCWKEICRGHYLSKMDLLTKMMISTDNVVQRFE